MSKTFKKPSIVALRWLFSGYSVELTIVNYLHPVHESCTWRSSHHIWAWIIPPFVHSHPSIPWQTCFVSSICASSYYPVTLYHVAFASFVFWVCDQIMKPGISGRVQTPKGGTNLSFHQLSCKLHENEDSSTRRGGGHASEICLCRSATDLCRQDLFAFLRTKTVIYSRFEMHWVMSYTKERAHVFRRIYYTFIVLHKLDKNYVTVELKLTPFLIQLRP